jgi:hypothetical protein
MTRKYCTLEFLVAILVESENLGPLVSFVKGREFLPRNPSTSSLFY